MSQIFIPSNDPILTEVLAAYEFPATLLGAVRYGQGHINDTFCVLCQPQEGDAVRFILQGLSSAASNLANRSSVLWKFTMVSWSVAAG